MSAQNLSQNMTGGGVVGGQHSAQQQQQQQQAQQANNPLQQHTAATTGLVAGAAAAEVSNPYSARDFVWPPTQYYGYQTAQQPDGWPAAAGRNGNGNGNVFR
jgi:hypothetical protein